MIMTTGNEVCLLLVRTSSGDRYEYIFDRVLSGSQAEEIIKSYMPWEYEDDCDDPEIYISLEQVRIFTDKENENLESQVVGWECKDYADGWIRFNTLLEALSYQNETDCIMRPVR